MADVPNAVGSFSVKDAEREAADALDRRFLNVKIAAKDTVIHDRVHPAIGRPIRGCSDSIDELERMKLIAGPVLGDEHVVHNRVFGEARQPLFQIARSQRSQIREGKTGLERLELLSCQPLERPIGRRSTGYDEDILHIRLQLLDHAECPSEVTFENESTRVAGDSSVAIVRQEHDRGFETA